MGKLWFSSCIHQHEAIKLKSSYFQHCLNTNIFNSILAWYLKEWPNVNRFSNWGFEWKSSHEMQCGSSVFDVWNTSNHELKGVCSAWGSSFCALTIMLIFWVILDFIDSGQKLGYIYQMDNGHSMWRSLSKNTSTTVVPKYLLQYSNCLIQVTDPQKLWSKFLEWLGNPQIPKTSSVFWWCMRPPRFTSVRGRIVFITASLFAGKRV